jgi:nitrite reductase/ring-hydroxylating ferredoxin subunit
MEAYVRGYSALPLDPTPHARTRLGGEGAQYVEVVGRPTCTYADARANSRLTQVDAGTPAGELLRRYWHPLCPANLLTSDKPVVALKILGDSLVVFRGADGSYGAIPERCPHRGASLRYGFVEDGGIRCSYHGWLFDHHGNVSRCRSKIENLRAFGWIATLCTKGPACYSRISDRKLLYQFYPTGTSSQDSAATTRYSSRMILHAIGCRFRRTQRTLLIRPSSMLTDSVSLA